MVFELRFWCVKSEDWRWWGARFSVPVEVRRWPANDGCKKNVDIYLRLDNIIVADGWNFRFFPVERSA